MSVYKAAISTTESEGGIIANLLAEAFDPAPAVCTSETPAGWVSEIYFEGLPDTALLNAIADDHPAASALRDLQFQEVPDENWVERTQRGLHPIESGRFFTHGSHDRPRARAKAFAIEIDAGEAFGTAHHGTTRGCLLMLDRLAKRGRACRALDLGTGSGVLTIAAAKSLCRDVLAADIDPIAVRVAAENFKRNGVSHRARAVMADGLKCSAIVQHAPFDLVTANILAGPLISLAPSVKKVMTPSGHLILSGLLDSQTREVTAQYLAQGFTLCARLSLEGWTTLLLHFGK